MLQTIKLLKGLHPGFFLEKTLKDRNIKKGKFALSINEYPQTLTTITKGIRGMNTALSLKIEKELQLEEGLLMTLQVFYDIKESKRKASKDFHPDISLFRKSLFWDTSIDKLDWQLQKNAIIKRVFERGNKKEQNELMSFYGPKEIEIVLKETKIDL